MSVVVFCRVLYVCCVKQRVEVLQKFSNILNKRTGVVKHCPCHLVNRDISRIFLLLFLRHRGCLPSHPSYVLLFFFASMALCVWALSLRSSAHSCKVTCALLRLFNVCLCCRLASCRTSMLRLILPSHHGTRLAFHDGVFSNGYSTFWCVITTAGGNDTPTILVK